MDRLREIEVFAEIADAGSLAEAGRRLRLSPPAVTRILAGLEERLGVRLIQRTTRRLSLTEAGLRFHEAAQALLSELEAAERDASGFDRTPRGRIAITASASFGRMAVAPVLAEFLAEHPQVRGALFLWDRVVNLVEEGIDLAVRIGSLPDMGFIATQIGWVRRLLVASPAYLARMGVPETPEALADHRLIAFRGLLPTDRIAFAGGSQRVSPWLELNDAAAALALAEAGHGIAVALSYMTAEAERAGRLVEVLASDATPARQVHLVWPEGRLPTQAVRAFIDHAKPRLARHLEAARV